MHKSEAGDDGSKRVVSQAEADHCCASSELDASAPSSAVFVLSVVLAVVPSPVPFTVPDVGSAIDAWRTLVPIPATHVPKHLLLSVILV
jgi:hypothetical protein